MEEKQCCGTCKHHRKDGYAEWACDNLESDNYADYTGYEDGEDCADYERR